MAILTISIVRSTKASIRQGRRLKLALQALEKSIARGRLKDRYKMERRLGRIQACHSQVNDLFAVTLRDTPAGVRLVWKMQEDRKAWRDLREGAYMLRTNLQADSAEQLWSKYMQLTEAEASFRALKSELSIRPLFHQKEPRVKAHVLVAFLGYALWVTLKHLLKRRPAITPQPSASGVDNAQSLSPMKVLALLSTLQSADIVLPTTDGREIRLRRITEPTAEQKSLLHQLSLSLPERLKSLSKCSAGSKIPRYAYGTTLCRVENPSLCLCRIGRLRSSRYHSVAEESEFPDHLRSASFPRSFAHRRTPFFVSNSLVQNQPDQPTMPMGDRPDGLVVSQARHQTAIHCLEDASFVLDRRVGTLIENAPHMAVALRGAVAVVHSRALLVARACANPRRKMFLRRKGRRLGTHFGDDLLRGIHSETGHLRQPLHGIVVRAEQTRHLLVQLDNLLLEQLQLLQRHL